jgi:nucleotide-binding universal stress UspA family protein
VRIVCGIDDSDGALRAARVAADLARRLDAHLVVAIVVSPVLHVPPEGRTPGGGSDREALLADRRERAGAVLARAARAAGVADDADLKVLAGDAARVLIAEARVDDDPALIVVGSRGQGAIRAAILGSVSSQLVRESPCPVVVVPAG